jgi:hypothetical protein
MKVLGVLTSIAALLLCLGCGQTGAVKQCRSDLQTITQELDSYNSEYTTLYGPTALAQSPIEDVVSREEKLSVCYLNTDPSHGEQYKAQLYRLSFVASSRLMKFIADTQQRENFAAWEKSQQATLASYRPVEK